MLYELHTNECDDEGGPAAAAVVAACTIRNGGADESCVAVDARHIGDAVLIAGDGVPDDETIRGGAHIVVVEEDAAVVAVPHMAHVTVRGGQAEGGRGGGHEARGLVVARMVEEAEYGGRRPVERTVAAQEAGVGEDAAPRLADGSGPDEARGFVRRDEEEDVGDEIVRERSRHAAEQVLARRVESRAREMLVTRGLAPLSPFRALLLSPSSVVASTSSY